jgi:hypothetical protein
VGYARQPQLCLVSFRLVLAIWDGRQDVQSRNHFYWRKRISNGWRGSAEVFQLLFDLSSSPHPWRAANLSRSARDA